MQGACKSLPSTPNTHYRSENVTKPITPNGIVTYNTGYFLVDSVPLYSMCRACAGTVISLSQAYMSGMHFSAILYFSLILINDYDLSDVFRADHKFWNFIEKRTQMPTQIWSTAAQARSFLWFLIMALVEMVTVLYRRVSWRPHENLEPENLEPTMDVETSIAPITKRVTNLEAEFSKFTLGTKSSTLDPSAERIKALEAELAETKKVSLFERFFLLKHNKPLFTM